MNRSEHLEWCKERALAYVDHGDIRGAYSSFSSDMTKHEETKNHPAIMMGMQMLTGGMLSTDNQMRRFIEGFN